MRRLILVLLTLLLMILLVACGGGSGDNGSSSNSEPASSSVASNAVDKEEKDMELTLTVDGKEVPVSWEDNESVGALKEAAPLEIKMSMYGGNEQVGPIGKELPSDDKNITTEAGDIVLYQSNQIVIFYGSNTWDYTPLGHVELSKDEMTELLDNGDVTIAIK